MNCKICHTETILFDEAEILSKYKINYFQCPSCGFIQTESPYWLDESYAESINASDTGIMKRNGLFARQSLAVLNVHFNTKGKYLDFAGGYGIYTRLMRDFGFDFYWYDKYSQNLVSRGFEHNEANTYELITAFECFEHFLNPADEVAGMLKLSKNILFSTELIPASNPKPDKWWYYGLDHGQHIALYSKKSLELLAKQFNLNFYTNGKNLHLFTEKKICGFLFKILSIFNGLFYHGLKHSMRSKTSSDFIILKGKN